MEKSKARAWSSSSWWSFVMFPAGAGAEVVVVWPWFCCVTTEIFSYEHRQREAAA
jgi:hypothetical protein